MLPLVEGITGLQVVLPIFLDVFLRTRLLSLPLDRAAGREIFLQQTPTTWLHQILNSLTFRCPRKNNCLLLLLHPYHKKPAYNMSPTSFLTRSSHKMRNYYRLHHQRTPDRAQSHQRVQPLPQDSMTSSRTSLELVLNRFFRVQLLQQRRPGASRAQAKEISPPAKYSEKGRVCRTLHLCPQSCSSTLAQ